jgi:hypothetical protein
MITQKIRVLSLGLFLGLGLSVMAAKEAHAQQVVGE